MGLERFFQTASVPDGSSPGYRIPAPPRNLARPARWIPPGETVEILDYIIRGGMLYVGTGMKDPSGTPEPALINPMCAVEIPSRAHSAKMLDYWPNYSMISPDARGAYLSWLASGRDNPGVEMGLVYLYFYGLERRAFIDGYGMPEAAEEWPLLRAEVTRLKELYGSHSFSFNSHAARFLEMTDVAKSPKNLVFGNAKYARGGDALPFALKMKLGELAIAAAPMSAELAFWWAQADPTISRSAVVKRCAKHFESLFLSHYREAHGEGLALPLTRTKLMTTYEPASQSVAGFGEIGLFLDDVPDVTVDGAVASKLQMLVKACEKELDAYSRFIGRNPDKRSSIQAELLLPKKLRAENIVGVIRLWQENVAAQPKVTTLGEIAASFDVPEDASRDELFPIIEALSDVDIQLEPDFSGRMPKMTDVVVLFASPKDDPALRTKDEMLAAQASVHLACALVLPSLEKDETALSLVDAQITNLKHLSIAHRARLGARARLLQVAPLPPTSLKKSLATLDAEVRSGIGMFLCKVAQAAGDPSVETIKELGKSYKLLGLTADNLNSDLHAAALGSNRQQKPGMLDHSRIAQLQADTASVGALLSNVFSEEPLVSVPATHTAKVSEEELILGLDAAHSSLARLLLTQKSWPAAALRAEAKKLGLMPDGALEQLNEAAFDAFDIPFGEGDDPFEINPDLMMELDL